MTTCYLTAAKLSCNLQHVLEVWDCSLHRCLPAFTMPPLFVWFCWHNQA